jgi:histidinol phosphatase-like enzyme
MKSKLNAEWHHAHKMPKNPNLEQRVAWHAEHAKHCECRKPTGAMLEELKKRGLLS